MGDLSEYLCERGTASVAMRIQMHISLTSMAKQRTSTVR
jgi:hypothetical protein